MDIVDDELNEMRKEFPDFRIIKESGKDLNHTATAFLCEKTYNKFKAKIYAHMMTGCSLSSDIYENDRFQYSLGTCSGIWRENFNRLEEALNNISTKGLDAVKSQFDGEKLGIYQEKSVE